MTRGKGGAKSKDVYYYMFREYTQEFSWMHDICTQPLLEQHPDYCVVMVGINDAWKKRPVSYYTGNSRLIIRLLLANDIRPVVMEIPDFEMGEWLNVHRRRQRILYRFYSFFTGVVKDDITPFREGLKEMLKETGLGDSVLFIPVDHWIPAGHNYSEEIYQEDHVHINYQGYHVLDSCIISEILSDFKAYGKEK
jgi:lysophospholipase L1-like esterase